MFIGQTKCTGQMTCVPALHDRDLTAQHTLMDDGTLIVTQAANKNGVAVAALEGDAECVGMASIVRDHPDGVCHI